MNIKINIKLNSCDDVSFYLKACLSVESDISKEIDYIVREVQ